MADRRPQLRSSPRSHGGSELQSYAAGKRQKPQETRLRLNKRGINRSAALWVLCRCRHNTHWSGGEKRLDRIKKFNDRSAYAFEELVAEIGACILAVKLGIEPDFDQSAAYVESWLKALKDDKNLIFKAASEAQKAVDFIVAATEATQQGEAA
ncbi:zincin-like metallopeptidase domain-containing protein [Phaeobacter inhibens]|uniref:zincin-like metallopeptidase domain-containing protein n=1 Tax=Phaeobacter inhibens TaxID=221822 RepID=UPI000CA3D1A2|nr:zincin-like metallopeptidase domain-containing protein [Phaeobacter inhibens]AUR22521.1 putative ArdC antirestriction protein [Phaeobacter inhibens]